MVGVVLLQIANGFLKCHQSLYSIRLVECEVWLVCYTIGCSSVDDSLVEGKQWILLAQQVLRYLVEICVETYAKEGFLILDLLDKMLLVHYFLISVFGNSIIVSFFRADAISLLTKSSAGTVRSFFSSSFSVFVYLMPIRLEFGLFHALCVLGNG